MLSKHDSQFWEAQETLLINLRLWLKLKGLASMRASSVAKSCDLKIPSSRSGDDCGGSQLLGTSSQFLPQLVQVPLLSEVITLFLHNMQAWFEADLDTPTTSEPAIVSNIGVSSAVLSMSSIGSTSAPCFGH